MPVGPAVLQVEGQPLPSHAGQSFFDDLVGESGSRVCLFVEAYDCVLMALSGASRP